MNFMFEWQEQYLTRSRTIGYVSETYIYETLTHYDRFLYELQVLTCIIKTIKETSLVSPRNLLASGRAIEPFE